MTLNPVAVVDQVLGEYRGYLSTEFQARDPQLHDAAISAGVRPADRDALFANHRCRFVVLDEVHSYRGSLGANIALLFRRLGAHLRHARQDWRIDDRADARRFPEPLPVATSATIKSVDETGRSPEEVQALRESAVRDVRQPEPSAMRPQLPCKLMI